MKKRMFLLSIFALLFACTGTTASSSDTSSKDTSNATTDTTTETTTSDEESSSSVQSSDSVSSSEEISSSESESSSSTSSSQESSSSSSKEDGVKSIYLEENEDDWELTNGVITNDLTANDKMLKITGNEEAKSNYLEIEKLTGDFKVTFNLYCDSTANNAFGIKFYNEEEVQFTRLKFDTTKIKYNNTTTTIGQNFKANYWFDVDFVFKDNGSAYVYDFYLNGEKLGSNLVCDESAQDLNKLNFYTDSKKTGYSFYVNELQITRDLNIETNAPKDPVVPDFPEFGETGEKVEVVKQSLYNQLITEIDEEASIPQGAITATPSDFQAKVTALEAGQTLVLEDGIYTINGYIKLSNSGTEDAPIVVMARHTGKAIFKGSVQFQIGLLDNPTKTAVGGDYITFSGMKFTDGYAKDSGIFKVYGSHFRLTNVVIDGYDKNTTISNSVWVQIIATAKYAEIDHCTFINKHNSYGVMIYLRKETYDDGAMYAYIHNNYFGNYTNPDPDVYDNGLETIRMGWSGAQGDCYSIVENNVFEDITSEPELISVKSCHNVVRGNLIIRCTAAITLRHGFYNIVENNIILGEGIENANGIRVFGNNHIIRNNFISGVPNNSSTFYGGLVLHNGSGDAVTGSGQCTTNNSIIENNTFLNNYFNICLGDNKYSKVPHDLTLKNNLVYTNEGAAIRQYRGIIASNITYQNEQYFASSIGFVDNKVPSGVTFSNQFTSVFNQLPNGLVEATIDCGAKNLVMLSNQDITITSTLSQTEYKSQQFFTSNW